MQPRFDILGLGCTAVDDILYVATYPPADAKAEVRSRERHCGGLTATALVAGARLGARCAYAGTLGYDDSSRFVLETFQREGINIRHVVRRTEAGPVRSVIVVNETLGTRNIFYDHKNARGADSQLPGKDVILSTRVLLVDRFGVSGMVRAARIARAARIPVVADLEGSKPKQFAPLLRLVDHLIVSEDFAQRLTGTRHPASAVAKLRAAGHTVVVVTCGESGCWFQEQGWKLPSYHAAYKVEAVDTTGCGDVFHGAYAFALARGMPLLKRIRLASATAALKATRRGGQAGIPTFSTVQKYLKHR